MVIGMSETKTNFVDVDGRLLAKGDMLSPTVGDAIGTGLYRVVFFNGDRAALETYGIPAAPLISATSQDIATGFVVITCSSCKASLQIRYLEVNSVLIEAPERHRCNRCTSGLLAEWEVEAGGGEPT